jgi:hypothetical protein
MSLTATERSHESLVRSGLITDDDLDDRDRRQGSAVFKQARSPQSTHRTYRAIDYDYDEDHGVEELSAVQGAGTILDDFTKEESIFEIEELPEQEPSFINIKEEEKYVDEIFEEEEEEREVVDMSGRYRSSTFSMTAVEEEEPFVKEEEEPSYELTAVDDEDALIEDNEVYAEIRRGSIEALPTEVLLEEVPTPDIVSLKGEVEDDEEVHVRSSSQLLPAQESPLIPSKEVSAAAPEKGRYSGLLSIATSGSLREHAESDLDDDVRQPAAAPPMRMLERRPANSSLAMAVARARRAGKHSSDRLHAPRSTLSHRAHGVADISRAFLHDWAGSSDERSCSKEIPMLREDTLVEPAAGDDLWSTLYFSSSRDYLQTTTSIQTLHK